MVHQRRARDPEPGVRLKPLRSPCPGSPRCRPRSPGASCSLASAGRPAAASAAPGRFEAGRLLPLGELRDVLQELPTTVASATMPELVAHQRQTPSATRRTALGLQWVRAQVHIFGKFWMRAGPPSYQLSQIRSAPPVAHPHGVEAAVDRRSRRFLCVAGSLRESPRWSIAVQVPLNPCRWRGGPFRVLP